jgi:mRNA-degrading endonuclease toxin of MazEF toxin-antitoxin module
MLRRGHLYWAHLDKRRPVLVLSPEARNEHAHDVIVVPLSTRLRLGPWHVTLSKGEAGLPWRSVAKCELISTLPKELIETRALGASVSPHRLGEIERAVLRAIGVPVGY